VLNKSPGTYSTTKSWSISGVPRIIHTKVFESHLSGLNFDIEQNITRSPAGTENRSVSENSFKFSQNPFKSSIDIFTKESITSP